MTRSDDQPAESTFSCAEQLLEISLSCGELITAISRSVFVLKQKRTTLEEKAIMRYLHQCTNLIGLIIAKLHFAFANNKENTLNQINVELLRSTTVDLRTRVDELLKILHYNFNFLEQYFEYDYVNKLTNESLAVENLQAVYDSMPS